MILNKVSEALSIDGKKIIKNFGKDKIAATEYFNKLKEDELKAVELWKQYIEKEIEKKLKEFEGKGITPTTMRLLHAQEMFSEVHLNDNQFSLRCSYHNLEKGGFTDLNHIRLIPLRPGYNPNKILKTKWW